MEVIKAQRIKTKTGKRCTRLTYKDETFEEFEVVRGSISWPHGTIPGVILIGGLLRGTETIKVLEETSFEVLSEAKKLLLDHKAKYSNTLDCICYQNIPEGEGFVKYLKGRDEYSMPHLSPAPYSESIDYGIQLVSSYLDDKKLKVPVRDFLLHNYKRDGKMFLLKRISSGVIALGCLIEGKTSNFFEDCEFVTFDGAMREAV